MLKQEHQQKPIESAGTDNSYEWSFMRIAEGVTTNVVSAIIIGSLAIISGTVYAGWTLLLIVLHTPDGLIGILAFILLGAILMLIVLIVAVIAWFRGTSSAALVGMLIGAMIGAALGAAIDSGKLSEWVAAAVAKQQEQKNATKTEGE